MTIRFQSKGQVFDTGLCDRNLNLLAHAQCIELDIGSRCGGHGICGGDRVLIPEGLASSFSPVTDLERRLLGEELLAQGWRLGCQCWPENSDLSLNAEASPIHLVNG